MSMAIRVAARFLMADQPPGARQHAKKLTKPINAPRGIHRSLVRDNGETMLEDAEVNKRDIQPKDVFNLTPNFAGVINLVETGKDMQKAIDKSIPKDKGYSSVYNLSQYLIKSDDTQNGRHQKSRNQR